MPTLKLGNVTAVSESGGTLTFPTGHIIQVRSNTVTSASYDGTQTGYNSTNSGGWVDVQSATEVLSHTITPQTGNHVYVRAAVCIGAESNYQWDVRLVRGSTAICISDAADVRPRATFGGMYIGDQDQKHTWPVEFLDTTPGGNGSTVITYKFQWQAQTGGRLTLNNAYNDSQHNYRGRGVSTITLMEIQA